MLAPSYPIAQYNQSPRDTAGLDAHESMLGHLVLEQQLGMDAALYYLESMARSEVKGWRKTIEAAQWGRWAGVGAGAVAFCGGGFGIAGIVLGGLLVGVGSGSAFWLNSVAESTLPFRELESNLISTYPEIRDKLMSLVESGFPPSAVIAAYDRMIKYCLLAGGVSADPAVIGAYWSQATSAINQERSAVPIAPTSWAATEQPIATPPPLALPAQPIAPTGQPGSPTTLQLGSSTALQPVDLAGYLLSRPETCHFLIAGENGTGKTTITMALLKPTIEQFSQIPGFDLLIIDPKRSSWGGLCNTKAYQSAFSSRPEELEKAVDRLEKVYHRLDRLSLQRQSSGKRSEVPSIVLIDEVNTWLASLIACDRNTKEQNSRLKPDERYPADLYNRATDAIAGISRMGREDRVWIWCIGQNPNLEPLGLKGAADRANFTTIAVGRGDNQITIDLALSNQTMFPRGQKLRDSLRQHQGQTYQIAACSRSDEILRMPDYSAIANVPFSADVIARLNGQKVEAPSADPWTTYEVPKAQADRPGTITEDGRFHAAEPFDIDKAIERLEQRKDAGTINRAIALFDAGNEKGAIALLKQSWETV